jgi:hypothetical protein
MPTPRETREIITKEPSEKKKEFLELKNIAEYSIRKFRWKMIT